MSQVQLTESLTGLAIREFLQHEGEGSANDFIKAFRLVKKKTSYASARRYFWILKKLGLVQPTRRVMGKGLIPKQLYRIVPGRENDSRWAHPQIALYPSTGAGRSRYRRRG